MKQPIEAFLKKEMRKGDRWVAARLQAAMALLEALRSDSSLDLETHMSSAGSSGLKRHEPLGAMAHKRFNIERINKTHGRRSSQLREWGPKLLKILQSAGFPKLNDAERDQSLTMAQELFANRLREILEAEPLVVAIRGHSSESVVREVLKLAEEKGKAGDVAQYLVGAKLELRFACDIPVHGANKGDRKSRSDRDARLGDFEIANAVIEVALGLPDEKHIEQILDALEVHDTEVWLLTHTDRVSTWKDELRKCEGLDMRRVVVRSVDAFVGQNVSELGKFTTEGKVTQIKALFEIYNNKWIAKRGTPGIRIEIRGSSGGKKRAHE